MIRVSELEGVELDYWTGFAAGLDVRFTPDDDRCVLGVTMHPYRPSTDWSDCGPLIERFSVWVECAHDQRFPGGRRWSAYTSWERPTGITSTRDEVYGPTPQIAICRAVVAGRFGAEFEPTGEQR